MKRGTPDHPKTLALQAALKCSRPEAVGLLELLWHWTARYAPAGDVGRWADAALASGCGWDGEPETLVEAFVGAGFLDRHDEARLIVHDWPEHADDAVRVALYRAVKFFADGSEPKPSRISKLERERLEERWAEARRAHKRAHAVRTESAQPEPRQSPALAPPDRTETDSRGASAPTATKRPRRPRALPPDSAHAVAEACDDWTEALGGTAPGKRIAGAWPGLLKLAPWSEVRPVWQWYLREGKASGKAEYCNPQDFAGRYDYWRQRCNGLVAAPRAPGRQIESVAEENLASLRRVLAESGQTLEGELARVGGFGLIGGQ